MAKNVMTKGQKESHKAMKLSLFPGFMFVDEFQPHICFYFLPSKRAETKGEPNNKATKGGIACHGNILPAWACCHGRYIQQHQRPTECSWAGCLSVRAGRAQGQQSLKKKKRKEKHLYFLKICPIIMYFPLHNPRINQSQTCEFILCLIYLFHPKCLLHPFFAIE